VQLLGAVAALRETIGLAIRAFDRPTHEKALAATKAALDGHTFNVAWAEGQAMTLEQVVGHALEETT